jgi:hypothetical protein
VPNKELGAALLAQIHDIQAAADNDVVLQGDGVQIGGMYALVATKVTPSGVNEEGGGRSGSCGAAAGGGRDNADSCSSTSDDVGGVASSSSSSQQQ